tara:strand:+ start:11817 stop:12338 length:522 start_codon:yes stop_codon:yes gene_type:complete
MTRIIDLVFSFLGLVFLLPILIVLFIIGFFENGSPLFFQTRVGRHQRSFIIVKFRSMPLHSLSVPTHLMKNIIITSFGNFLRKTKLDEIPQLYNVLKGDMSLVGPRPCLLSQKRLINERKKRGVFKVRPGITGLAQISFITMKKPKLLAKTDSKMIKKMNLFYYFYYILKTIL